jgi:uncharacterized surface protein with fasciclin (FAS1) repeats
MMNILETAAQAGSFKTLGTAVAAAGLTETLDGTGPFTVFAPTDAAFAALPEGTVANLLKPENKAQLAALLTYHVLPGKVSAKDVGAMHEAKTVQGAMLPITSTDGVHVKGSKVTKADIQASNGVIHVIDKVLVQ